jgi:excisionase family DNA binding protein
VNKLVDALLDELAADPAALKRLRAMLDDGRLAAGEGGLGYAATVEVPALLSVAHVARLLDCSPRTVRRRIDEGDLPAVRDPGGRLAVRGDDLLAYVERMERTGTRPGRRSRARRAGSWDFLRDP